MAISELVQPSLAFVAMLIYSLLSPNCSTESAQRHDYRLRLYMDITVQLFSSVQCIRKNLS
jgi:hypothetical protein